MSSIDLYDKIKELRNESLIERNQRKDNRWIAPYYHGLQDFQKGQHVWSVGTVGERCDNRIWEEIITGEMQVDDYGYLKFLTQGVDNNIRCWHRFGSFGCSVFFTKEEAEIVLKERFEETYAINSV